MGGTLFSGKMKNINSLCDRQSYRDEGDDEEAQDEIRTMMITTVMKVAVSVVTCCCFSLQARAAGAVWFQELGGTIPPLEIPIFGGLNQI